MKKFEPRAGFTILAHKAALDPNAAQLGALRSHCGAARVAYNWAVRRVTASWSQRAAEETYGIPEEERTEWRSWSLPSLRKAFNAANFWKGLARYYTVTGDGRTNPNAGWYYPHPSPLARRIKNHVAFWHGVVVEGVPEPPQDNYRHNS